MAGVVVFFFSSFYGDKMKHAFMVVVLAVAVAAIITVIKSSLALSLGLVGALSIVRFRTPVKDPEQLLHYFIAIVIGIGMGAGMIDIVAAVMILFSSITVVFWFVAKKTNNHSLNSDDAFFSITFVQTEPKTLLLELNNLMSKHNVGFQIRNITASQETSSINMVLKNTQIERVGSIGTSLQSTFPDDDISYDFWANTPQTD